MSITLVFDLSRFANERPRTGVVYRRDHYEMAGGLATAGEHAWPSDVVTPVLLVIALFQEIGDGAVGLG